MLSIFSCAYCPSVYLHWRNVYLGLMYFSIGLLSFLLLSCMSCLYILEIKPLSVASFANISSQSVSCLFVLFMVSCAVQKLESLTGPTCLVLLLLLLPWETNLRKYCYEFCWRMFCLCSLLEVVLYVFYGLIFWVYFYVWCEGVL